MSEYEWEEGRLPKVSRLSVLGAHRSRTQDLEAYVSLECPRESVGWLLHESSRSNAGKSSAKRTGESSPIREDGTLRKEGSGT